MKYLSILNRIYNVPLAIHAEKLAIISSEIGIKLLNGQEVDSIDKLITPEFPKLVSVFGTLVSKNGGGDSGSTSYQNIKSKIDYNLASGIKNLGFYVDSYGGEFNGLLGLSNYIYSLRNKGIRTFAITDGAMDSAAYTIGAATEKIYAVPGSSLGSIGIVADLIDLTAKDTKEGVKHTIIRSKELKASYNPHETATSEVKNHIIARVNKLDNLLNQNINLYRPMLSIDDIIGLKGDDFVAENESTSKLYDLIVSSVEEAIDIEMSLQENSNKAPTSVFVNTEKLNIGTKMSDPVKTENEISANEIKVAIKAGIDAERERCIAIVKAATTLRIDPVSMLTRITRGTSAEDSLDIFTAIAEGLDKTKVIEANPIPAANLSGEGSDRAVEIFGQKIKISDMFAK